MKDYLIRGLAFNDEIRFFVTKTTDLVEEIRKRHDAYPTAIAATGRVATVTTMNRCSSSWRWANRNNIRFIR